MKQVVFVWSCAVAADLVHSLIDEANFGFFICCHI